MRVIRQHLFAHPLRPQAWRFECEWGGSVCGVCMHLGRGQLILTNGGGYLPPHDS